MNNKIIKNQEKIIKGIDEILKQINIEEDKRINSCNFYLEKDKKENKC